VLGELWNLIKSFRKRFFLYYVVVLAVTLFGTFPILIVKLGAFVVFLAASILFVPVITSQYVSTIQQFVSHRNRIRLPISTEILDLSNRAGVKLTGLGIVKGCNAYVLGRSLVLGKELLERLDFNQRQAVVAHELGHVKKRVKHAVIRLVWFASLLAVLFYGWSRMSSPIFFSESVTQLVLTAMLNIALLAFMTVVMIPINWYVEFDADRTAVELAGNANIKSALLKIANERSLKEPSETHPSIEERVKRIDKVC